MTRIWCCHCCRRLRARCESPSPLCGILLPLPVLSDKKCELEDPRNRLNSERMAHGMHEELTADRSANVLYRMSLLFALLTLPALLLDLPLARAPLEQWLPGDLHRIIGWSELFAHGYGVALIGLTVYVLDVPNRLRVPRLLASAYVAGLIANVAKLLVARVRPRYFDFDGNVLHTFLGFLPGVFAPGSQYHKGFEIQSFPSGHTATAVGLAVGLASLYPRGRWLFFSFALLAVWQRIDVHAHYLSDTVAAASLGFLGAALVFDPRALGRWFDRLEHRLGLRAAAE